MGQHFFIELHSKYRLGHLKLPDPQAAKKSPHTIQTIKI